MTRYHNINGKLIAYSAEQEITRNEEEAAAITEKTATKYQRDRAAEYPSVVDQLDLIYHSGVDAWKAKIKETKDKYPKS